MKDIFGKPKTLPGFIPSKNNNDLFGLPKPPTVRGHVSHAKTYTLKGNPYSANGALKKLLGHKE